MTRTDELKEIVKRDYNREDAWRMRQNPNLYWLETEKSIVSQMLPRKAARVLDIGCGRGDYLGMLAQVSREVVALDFADILLKDAQKKSNPKVTDYILGDATSLPFAADSFDLVLAAQVIAHIPNPDAFLQEINRVLKKARKIDNKICAFPHAKFLSSLLILNSYKIQ